MNQKIITRVKKQFRLKELEVASSPWKLALGLMFRKRLPKGKGMLFDFHFKDRHGIWMLFMRFPIDICFLDEDGTVLDKIKKIKPVSLFRPSTWRIYRPGKACRYAVEVRASSVRK